MIIAYFDNFGTIYRFVKVLPLILALTSAYGEPLRKDSRVRAQMRDTVNQLHLYVRATIVNVPCGKRPPELHERRVSYMASRSSCRRLRLPKVDAEGREFDCEELVGIGRSRSMNKEC